MLPGLPRGPGSQSRCREERTGRVRGAGAFIWAVGISTPMSGRANRKGRGRLSPPEGVSHPCSTQELGLCSRTWRRAVLSALCRLARLSEPHTLPGPLTRPLCRGREPPGGEPPACSQRPAPLCISRGSTELCVLRPGATGLAGPASRLCRTRCLVPGRVPPSAPCSRGGGRQEANFPPSSHRDRFPGPCRERRLAAREPVSLRLGKHTQHWEKLRPPVAH